MPKMEDVTDEVLANTSGPGEWVQRVKAAKPAKTLTPSLQKTLDEWRRRSDRSLPHVSNVLAYGFSYPKKSEHSNLMRLVKGGHLRVCRVDGKPPEGSHAKHKAPFSDRYYILRESCATEVPDGTLYGRRRK